MSQLVINSESNTAEARCPCHQEMAACQQSDEKPQRQRLLPDNVLIEVVLKMNDVRIAGIRHTPSHDFLIHRVLEKNLKLIASYLKRPRQRERPQKEAVFV